MSGRAVLQLVRLRLRFMALLQAEVYTTIVWAAVLGALGALSSLAFRAGVNGIGFLLTGRHGDPLEVAASLPWWLRLSVPAVGGAAAGLTLYLGSRVLREHRSTDYMEAIVLGDGVIRVRATFVRALSAMLSIASGASIGREGPMVQLSAMLGSVAARLRALPVPRRRLLVACGAAAGIASAYNAPISGALFVSEIVFGSIAMESLGPMIISSMAASLTLRYTIGAGPIFEMTTFRLLSPAELGAYALLGLLAGVSGPWFLHLLRRSERLFHSIPGLPWIRMTVGGLAVGALSLAVPEVWGNGYMVVNSMLHTNWTWSALVIVTAFKLAATAASVGSGAVGGVFTPTLFIGASLGSLMAIPLQRQWPGVIASPQAYALVGMGCFLSATTHAPLMAILMVFEMTLDYSVVIPLTLACVIAYFVAYGIEKDSIYSRTLARKRQEPKLSEIKVRDLMKPEPWTVFENASFSEVTAHFARAQQEHLFVVSAQGVFRGAIPLNSMRPWLQDPDLQPWAIAGDIVEQVFPTVTPDMSLAELIDRFAPHRGNRLAVVEPEGGRLVASVSKTDLLLAIAHGVGSPSRGAAAKAR